MDREMQEVSEAITAFLNYIEQAKTEYTTAHEAVGTEDKRLQDLLHELEFAENENKKRRAGTKLQQSRRERRRQKDKVKRLERLVKFCNEPENKKTLNRMRQMLGEQRKEEKYLNGKRVYKPRMEAGKNEK